MKLIITGASGFIGSSYITKNSEHEIKSICLIKNKLLSLNFKGYDVLIHLAALVHQMKGAPEAEYFKVNSDLAFETALKAKNEGVKQFIFLSTIKVYGESTTGRAPFTEDSACNPQDAYGKSKLDAEKRIMSLADDNFNVAIIRSPLVYGAGVKANMYSLIKLIDKIPFLPLGKINNKRSFVYVDNLIALINRIINCKASGIFLAGDTENLSTTELAMAIAKALNKKRALISMPFLLRKMAAVLFSSYYDRLWGSLELNHDSGWKRIGFVPQVTFEKGITEMVKWYCAINNAEGNSNE